MPDFILFRFRKLICFMLLCTRVNCVSQVMWQINKDTVITWRYQEGDEFKDEKVNTEYWNYWYGWGRNIISNKEQQYYSDGKNHEMKDGCITLTAKKEDVTAKYIDWMGENDSIKDSQHFYGFNKMPFKYSAGLIQSKKDFLYGYFEIKFTMNDLKGYWPAFWLYGGTPNEEIDMMELKTEKKNKIHVGRHSAKKEENYSRVFLTKKVWGDWVKFNGDLTTSYNVIAGEWTKDYVKYYLNGECIAVTYLGLHQPKKLVANIAVPANNGPFKPGPPEKQEGIGEFKIDYIRVWTNESTGEQKRIPANVSSERESMQRCVGGSSLISKKKYIYGKRSQHANEGITVSLFSSGGAHYVLTVLGKDVPDDASFRIFSGEKEVMTQKLAYGISDIDLTAFEKAGELKIEINSFGKKFAYPLVPVK
jgi:beta-glucanase (GH16 family)